MALAEYRRKRKFDHTPEPKGGKSGKAARGPLRFCVQMHAASRMHWDFRLEIDGVLKSWAVPRGPSLSPLEQRLAVYVEDHPIEYGEFEGIIPKGNYGAGTVVLWDRGTYVERGSTGRADSEAALKKGLAEGHITFLLDGEKLKGEFALVRLKKSREQNAWLLLKKRDEYAVDRPDRQPTHESVKTGRMLEEIAAEAAAKGEVWLPKGSGKPAVSPKHPSSKPIGAPNPKGKPARSKGESSTASEGEPAARKTAAPATKSQARAAPLLHRVKPMIPATATRAQGAPKGWITHALPDGPRAIAEVDSGAVKLHSKDLLPLNRRHPEIIDALSALKRPLVLDGVIDENRFVVIDLLHSEGKDLRELPLYKRLSALAKLPIFKDPIELGTKSSEGPTLLARAPDSRYVSGVAADWLKLKNPDAGRSDPHEAPETEERGAPLTHPDKILWPREKYTKRDLVEYYQAVASAIVPHLRGRPQSMHRHPDGITRPGFFHKDLTGYYPRWIQTVRVGSHHSKKTINYLLCNDERTLLYMANLGCIELNPWLSREPELDRPDFSIIDLDPADGMDFDVVVDVARVVKEVLDSVGAPSFVKTSGSSGLHIYVPTGGKGDYELTRNFALAVCEQVHDRLPDVTSLNRNPAARRRKLYLDCFQNARGQTVAAPYCVRPKPGATVSTPLHWKEVRHGLDLGQFTIKTVPKRLGKLGDLWAPLLKARFDLARALAELQENQSS